MVVHADNPNTQEPETKAKTVSVGCCIDDEGLMLRIRMGITYSKLFW